MGDQISLGRLSEEPDGPLLPAGRSLSREGTNKRPSYLTASVVSLLVSKIP